MKSLLHTGASLLLKVGYEDGSEKTIGFARNLNFSVSNGQKVTYVVDQATPAEIAQGAAPSFVKGSLNIYLPKGTNPEAMGLVAYRHDAEGNQIAVLSKHLHFKIYDRATLNLIFTAEYCKVSTWSFVAQARGIVEIQLQFDGVYLTPGLSI
jgi:hypothetical protein